MCYQCHASMCSAPTCPAMAPTCQCAHNWTCCSRPTAQICHSSHSSHCAHNAHNAHNAHHGHCGHDLNNLNSNMACQNLVNGNLENNYVQTMLSSSASNHGVDLLPLVEPYPELDALADAMIMQSEMDAMTEGFGTEYFGTDACPTVAPFPNLDLVDDATMNQSLLNSGAEDFGINAFQAIASSSNARDTDFDVDASLLNPQLLTDSSYAEDVSMMDQSGNTDLLVNNGADSAMAHGVDNNEMTPNANKATDQATSKNDEVWSPCTEATMSVDIQGFPPGMDIDSVENDDQFKALLDTWTKEFEADMRTEISHLN